jgi:protein-S-isoprenylcysteine O-methyltransferase Ste14
MTRAILGSAFVLLLAIVYAYFYREHASKSYIRGKTHTIEFGRSYRFINPFFWLGVGVASIGALLSDHAVFLKVHDNVYCYFLGLLLGTVGTGVFVAAKWALGSHYSPCFDSYVPTAIVRRGIYKYVRHPIYSSNLLMLIGLFLLSGSLWLLISAVLLACYYVPSAWREEAALGEHFPEYREYSRHTKRFLPFLY